MSPGTAVPMRFYWHLLPWDAITWEVAMNKKRKLIQDSVTLQNDTSVTSVLSLDAKALDVMLSIEDNYSEDTRYFIDFLRSGNYGLTYEGLKAYVEYLNQEHDGKVYAARTFNKRVAAAKNRIRHITKQMDLKESLRYKLEQALNEIKAKKINSNAVNVDRVLTYEEVQALILGTGDKTVSLVVEFLAYTGCRISETLNILLSDLRLRRSYYEVRVLGKKRKERFIKVDKNLIECICEHFNGKKWLFEHSGKQYNRVSITSRIKLESLKVLGKNISAHTLRHSYATRALKKTGRIRAVQEQLGHSSASTTIDLYVHDTFSWEEQQEMFN